MTREPTGRVAREGERVVLTLTREFRAPIEDVWAAVTESDRLARWIGTWIGDPSSGHVGFTMTAEGATEPDDMEIRECVPPRLLRLTSHLGWHLDLHLAEEDGVTTLTFTQPDIDPVEAGPGPEAVALTSELRGDLERALRTLPEDQRLIVLLSDVHGLSYPEVAEAASIPVGTVKSRLSRARARLREVLTASGELIASDERLGDAR